MKDNGAEQLDELDQADANNLTPDDPNLATDEDGDLSYLNDDDDAAEDFTEPAGAYHSVTDGEVD